MDVKEKLWEVLKSPRVKMKRWLRYKLVARGVEPKFADILSRRKAADESLLELKAVEINSFFYGIIQEYKKAGFSEKDALKDPTRLKELRRFKLPISKATLHFNPNTLKQHRKLLKQLGLPVHPGTLSRNPEALMRERLNQFNENPRKKLKKK